MHSWSKAGLAALLFLVLLGLGCNDTYRPIANPQPLPGGDPGSFDVVAVLHPGIAPNPDIVSLINATGDTNVGNKQVGPGAAWLSFDASKSSIFTPNTTIDTVSSASISGVAIVTATMTPNSQPTFLGTRRSGFIYVVNQGVVDTCDVPAQGAQSASVGVVISSIVSLSQNICLKLGSAVSHHPVYLAQSPDGTRLVVVDDESNEAWILDSVANSVMANLPVGTAPGSVVISADSKTGYVINKGSNDITVLNLVENTVTTTVPVGGASPVFATLDTKLNRLYVVNQGDNSLSVFDVGHTVPVPLRTGIAVGPTPSSVAVLASGAAAYVANTGASFITRIDGNSFVRKDITVNATAGAKVNWVASSVAGLRVYATTYDPTDMSNGTAVLRTSDDVVVTTIPAPQQDLTCVPRQSPAVTCPLLRPTIIATRQ